MSFLCVFMVCLLSVIRLNGDCRTLSTQWHGNFSILMRDSPPLAVWIWASLEQALKGLNILFLWRDWIIAGLELPAPA